MTSTITQAPYGFAQIAILLITISYGIAEDQKAASKYRFVTQEAGNSIESYRCLGLAGGIQCLEQGTELDGVESSEDLAERLWKNLTHPGDEFVYPSGIRLRNGIRVPTCSKAAIEEIGFLIQEEYDHTISTKLWQENVRQPNPNTLNGRAILAKRQRYLDLFNKERGNRITSKEELKNLFRGETNFDLVAVAGWGRRRFENGLPQTLIDKRRLKPNPRTGTYPSIVASAHVFLLTYDESADLPMTNPRTSSTFTIPMIQTASGGSLSKVEDRACLVKAASIPAMGLGFAGESTTTWATVHPGRHTVTLGRWISS